jgi:ubiquinone biosynthesis protein
MRTQPRLIMLQKTMVVVEGVARNLDPELNMWTTAEPVVREWIERNLGPAGKLSEAAEGVGSLARLVGQMPVLAERAERVSADFARMAEDGLRLDQATVESLARAQAKRAVWTRAAVWVAAAALVAMAVGW